VLYRIRRRDLVRLDATEGVPGLRYRHPWIETEDSQGRRIRAVTYIADGNGSAHRLAGAALPFGRPSRLNRRR
jgi:cation transport regulator ChaC